jgi:hypothetical protein
VLSDHGADLWAIALVTVGVLLALAVYGDAAGAVGRAVDVVLGVAVGWARLLLPPASVAAGVVVVTGRRGRSSGRATAGAVIGLAAVCGLAELAGGMPTLSSPNAALAGAGGALGVLAGRPLAHGLGTAGAVILLLAIGAVGAVLATGVRLRSLGRPLVAAGALLGRALDRPVEVHDLGSDDAREPRRRRAIVASDSSPLEDLALDRGAAGTFVGTGEADGDCEVPAPEPASDTSGAPGVARADPREGPGGAEGLDEAEWRDAGGRATRRAVGRGGEGGPGEQGGPGGPGGPSSPGSRVGPAAGEWRLPPLRLLARSTEQRLDERLLDEAGDALVAALAAHGVETRLAGRTVGPTVTRYELELGAGVKVARVTSLSRDIAYAMASPDVRILAPIPGKSAIGVEVPNRQRQLVALGDILGSPEAARSRHPLQVALGRDIAGRPVMVNLTEMPHVLISGATGAGKSSCLNSLITSVLMRATPDEVRLILVDPKRVELGQYNGLPHLLTPVVVDPKKAANALSWAVKEMERRYDLLAELGMRDIAGYHDALARGELEAPGAPSLAAELAAVAARARAAARGAGARTGGLSGEHQGGSSEDGFETGAVHGRAYARAEGAGGEAAVGVDEAAGADVALGVDEALGVDVALGVDEAAGADVALGVDDAVGIEAGSADATAPERLPFILVVVDELNDLMMVAARDVEESVCRIAQMARAVGIHLVLATQRPSVDVITGLIKANIPSRIAFSVSSLADSRVILDQPGAERLVGKGDMLLLTASSSVPRRLQAPWVSEAEVRAVVGYWRRQGRVTEPVVGIQGVDDGPAGTSSFGDDDDELLETALELVVRSQLGSTSMLQRKLRVGFARAGRIMDLLERRGVVGPSEGSKARAVLMTPEELDSRPR